MSELIEKRLGAGSRVWIEGDSTLHRFRSESTAVDGAVSVAEGDVEAQVREGSVRGLLVRIPVQSLRSNESGLDDNLRDALQARRYPDITFRMESFTAEGNRLRARGRLSIAGTENAVEVEGTLTTSSGLRITGSKPLNMTDYGIKPPKLMMGVLRVKPEVVVGFEIAIPKK